jgi:hypothetical protein
LRCAFRSAEPSGSGHTVAALFHPLAMRGSGSLPFRLVAKARLMPPLTSLHLRPRSKSPTSVGAVIGLSAPVIEATEYFTREDPAGVRSGATLSLNILHRKNGTSITLLPEHLLHFERTRTWAAGLSCCCAWGCLRAGSAAAPMSGRLAGFFRTALAEYRK